jgi:hypothetical protein
MNFNFLEKAKESVNNNKNKILLILLSVLSMEAGAQKLEKKNYTLDDLNKIKTETLNLIKQLEPQSGSINVKGKTIKYEILKQSENIPDGESSIDLVTIKEIYKDSTVVMKDGMKVVTINGVEEFPSVGIPTRVEINKDKGETKVNMDVDLGRMKNNPEAIFDDEKKFNEISVYTDSPDKNKQSIIDLSKDESIQTIAGFSVLFKNDIVVILGKQK